MEMTRQEALELLELQEEATIEQIKQKYWEQYNEYNFSLTNAQTDLLKKKFGRKLEALNNAFQLLCPDVSLDDLKGLNLPMDSPIFNISPVYKRPEETENKESQKVGTKTNYKLLLLAGLIFVIGIAIGVWSLMTYFSQKKEMFGLEEKNMEYRTALHDINTIVGILKDKNGEIKNGKLKIVNLYKNHIQILWIGGIYLDEKTNKLISFDSNGSDIDGNPFVVEPYDGKNLSQKDIWFRKDGEIWDGKIIYYTMFVHVGYSYPLIYSGFWREKSHDNKYITITP